MHTLTIQDLAFMAPTWIERVFLFPVDVYFYILSIFTFLRRKMDNNLNNLPTKTDLTWLGIVTTVGGLVLAIQKVLIRRKQNVEAMYVKDRAEQSKEWQDLISAGQSMFQSMLALEKSRADLLEKREHECESKLVNLSERMSVCEGQRAGQEITIVEQGFRISELERRLGAN